MESINFKNTIKPEEYRKLEVFEIEKNNHEKIVSYKKKDNLSEPTQILYQEKYEIDEYYQHYLLERIYYDKENPNPEKPVYKETFEPNQEEYLEGSYVSYIKDPDGNFIGCRYYDSKQTNKSELLEKYESEEEIIITISSDLSDDKISNDSDKDIDTLIVEDDVDDSLNVDIIEEINYFTAIKDEKGAYKIVDKDTNTDQCRQVIRNIYKDMFEFSEPYEITGNSILTKGYMIALATENKNKNILIAENLEVTLNELETDRDGNPITYFNAYGDNYTTTLSDLAFDMFPSNYDKLSGKVGLIPFNSSQHTTGIFTEFEYLQSEHQYLTVNHTSLIDTSHANCPYDENGPSVDKKLFGKFDIKLANITQKPQLNGTCTQQISCVFDAIISRPEKYKNKNDIDTAIDNGSLFLDAYVIMSKIFDQKNNETVVHFANETDARSSTDKNFVFKLNDDYYGINKNFSENRFVNIEALKINELSCLNKEGKKLCEIDGFKNKCERQKQIVEIDEKIYSINKIYENQKEAFVAAYIMEFSDRKV